MADRILQSDPDPLLDDDYARRVLEVRGRRSGEVVRAPIAVVSRDGGQYLVSPSGPGTGCATY